MKIKYSINANRKWNLLTSALVFLCTAFLFPSGTLAQDYYMSGSDGGGTSSLTSSPGKWLPYSTAPTPAPAPNTPAAASYSYYCNVSPLRTPANGTSYTIYANPLTLGPSSTIGYKGYGVITFNNLVLNGAQINISGTGSPTGTGSGSGDDAYIAGFINLTASSQIHGGGLGNGVLSYWYVSAVITNDASSSPNLTLMNGGVVELLAQNTFTGNIIVSLANNSSGIPTVLQLGTNNAVPATAGITLNNGSSAGQNAIFDLHGFSATIANLSIPSGTAVGYVTNTAAATSTLTISNNSSAVALSYGNIADSASSYLNLVDITPALTLNNVNTYHGSTTISSGTLTLGSSGSINNSSAINIAAGATFDVSAFPSYTLSSSAFSASGTAASPATINGASGGGVSLGAQPISLTYTPTTFTGDASDAALQVSQGSLTLNNNSFAVTNASGTPMGLGTYQLIQVATGGSIYQNASPAYPVTVTGEVVDNAALAIQVVGLNVNLVVAHTNPTPVFSNLTPSQSVNYGTASITLSGTLSARSIYPAQGETITVTIDGTAQPATITNNTGGFSITYDLSGIPDSASTYTIYYSYGGDASLGIAEDTSTTLTVNTAPIIVQDVADTNVVLFAGGHATFAIVAGGTTPLYYQWYANNAIISGATNASYTLANARLGATTYYCQVTNFLGTNFSSTVFVTVMGATAPYAAAILADNPMGFWRLDESPDIGGGDDGVIANDYWGGNNGYYTNAQIGLLPGYSTTTDAAEPTAQFGFFAATDSEVVISNIDFSAPTNVNATFSIEAWVNGYTQSKGGPVVSKGYGGGGEEFCLDCGGTGGAFRFFVHTVSGAAPGVASAIVPSTGSVWYHLVGVCDEANGVVTLYVDGVSQGSAAIPAHSGIVNSSTWPAFIGARPSSASVGHNDMQFLGEISQVAIYNHALSASQVLAHFNGADVAPIIVQQPPSSTNVDENGSVSIPTAVIGTPTLVYQWIDQYQNPVPGQTNASLNLSDVPLSSNGNSYQLTVSNAYGSATSTAVTLNINSGTPPRLVVDLTPTEVAIVGTPYTYYVKVTGTEPFTYKWYENGVVIPGATSNSYPVTVVCGTNLFYVAITNTSGGVTSGIVSSTNTTMGFAGTPPLTFPSSGSTGWTLMAQSQGAPTLSDGMMVITTGSASEGRAAWYTTPQNITAFLAQFTYVVNTNSPIGPLGPADGITFCIQNVGTNAEGPGAGSLGVSGITPSVEYDINIYAGVTNEPPYYHPGPSMGWDTNGLNYAPVSTLPANLTNGNPMLVTIYYNGATASAWVTDLTLNTTSPVVSDSLNIPSVVGGNTAYIGFTGGTGGSWAEQDIYDFSFATVTVPTLSLKISGTNVVVSWPASTSSLYVLQSATRVQGPWTNVATGGLSSASGQIQYTTPHTGAAMFYRLMLPQ